MSCNQCTTPLNCGKWGCLRPRLSTPTPPAAEAEPLPENPKALYGRAKPSIGLVPAGALIQMAGVMGLGADKYGPFNWRKDPVQSMTYVHAAMRHLLSWLDGESTDPESGESHLAHVASCMAILMDAEACNTLIDDRPHKGAAATLIGLRTKAVTPNKD